MAAATLAAGLLIVVTSTAKWYRTRTEHLANAPVHVAQLSDSSEARWSEDGVPVQAGPLAAGRILGLQEGLAEITFDSGARVILQGPAVFELQTRCGGLLSHGLLTAHVPVEAAGFAVSTPHATLVDLGTEFGIAVDSNGLSQFEVFTGTVEISAAVESDSGLSRQQLKGGEGLRVRSSALGGPPQVNRIAAGGRRFIRSLAGNPNQPPATTEPDMVDCCSVPEASKELAGPRHQPKGTLVFIDLQGKANRKLSAATGGYPDNDLRELPQGEHAFAGVKFFVTDSVIQLGGSKVPEMPAEVTGIPIQMCASSLYILHATQYGDDRHGVSEATKIGEYRVRYADGSDVAIPIVKGQDLRDWWSFDGGKLVLRGQLVWAGRNPAADKFNQYLRLYLTVWVNPRPEETIVSFDYVSTMTAAAPFCVAVTAEEPIAASTSPASD